MSCRQLFAEPDGLERAQRFNERAKQAGKPCVFFFDGADTSYQPFPIEDAVVVRGSIYRSRRGAREFSLPGFHDDLTKYTSGELPIRRRSARPMVSYLRRSDSRAPAEERRCAGAAACGRSKAGLVACARPPRGGSLDPGEGGRRARGAGRRWGRASSCALPGVEAPGIASTGSCGRKYGPSTSRTWSRATTRSVRVETGTGRFVSTNPCASAGFLCSLTRIACSRTSFSSIGETTSSGSRGRRCRTLGDRIAAFHEQLSDREFVDLQHECRRLWEEWLSPHGFFRNFRRHFDFTSAAVGSVTPMSLERGAASLHAP